jgi:Arc-like DNA binding domain
MARADIQTSLRMPEDLKQRLMAEAEKNGYGVGVEICRRLEASFGSAPASKDPKTAELLRLIATVADYTGKQCGPWYENPYAYVVVRTAIEELLAQHQPEGEPSAPPGARGAFEGPPEQAGRVLASIVDIF